MIRNYTDADYPMLVNWWKEQKWPVIPKASLSNLGYISYQNNLPTAAAFLYTTNSNLAWLEWMIANPQYDWETRQEAIYELIDHISEEAKKQGYSILFTSVSNKRLMEKYVNKGFIVTDTDMTNMLRGL